MKHVESHLEGHRGGVLLTLSHRASCLSGKLHTPLKPLACIRDDTRHTRPIGQHLPPTLSRAIWSSRQELDDVALRVQHLDELGIDAQVLHNTLWIAQVAQWPDTEAALCRSWNRWLAEVWKQGQGRLRWSCVIPTMTLDEAVIQMRYAKEHGAVAVCMRPLEGDRLLTNRYFYPIYKEASRLDMAIAIHIANANPANCNLWRTAPGVEGLFASGFQMFRGPTVIACHVRICQPSLQGRPPLNERINGRCLGLLCSPCTNSVPGGNPWLCWRIWPVI
jgi:predicted TIM-barrel fold metal-dependent hydrolase